MIALKNALSERGNISVFFWRGRNPHWRSGRLEKTKMSRKKHGDIEEQTTKLTRCIGIQKIRLNSPRRVHKCGTPKAEGFRNGHSFLVPERGTLSFIPNLLPSREHVSALDSALSRFHMISRTVWPAKECAKCRYANAPIYRRYRKEYRIFVQTTTGKACLEHIFPIEKPTRHLERLRLVHSVSVSQLQRKISTLVYKTVKKIKAFLILMRPKIRISLRVAIDGWLWPTHLGGLCILGLLKSERIKNTINHHLNEIRHLYFV